jgi:hypothetical protein
VFRLSRPNGSPFFIVTLAPNMLTPKGAGFLYVYTAAAKAGGLARLELRPHNGGWLVVVWAYSADLSEASGQIEVLVNVGDTTGCAATLWSQTKSPAGWRLDHVVD